MRAVYRVERWFGLLVGHNYHIPEPRRCGWTGEAGFSPAPSNLHAISIKYAVRLGQGTVRVLRLQYSLAALLQVHVEDKHGSFTVHNHQSRRTSTHCYNSPHW